jgi:hypothetical protein
LGQGLGESMSNKYQLEQQLLSSKQIKD